MKGNNTRVVLAVALMSLVSHYLKLVVIGLSETLFCTFLSFSVPSQRRGFADSNQEQLYLRTTFLIGEPVLKPVKLSSS